MNVSCFGLHRSSRVLAHHCLLTLAGANGFRPGFCSFDAAACPQTPRFSDCSPSKHAEHKNQSDVVAYGLGCLARSRLGLARLGSAGLRKLRRRELGAACWDARGGDSCRDGRRRLALGDNFARGLGARLRTQRGTAVSLRKLSCTSKREREGRAFWLAGAGLERTALVWLTCAIASAIACSGD